MTARRNPQVGPITYLAGFLLVHRHSKKCGFLGPFADPSMVWMLRHQIMEDHHGYSVQEVHHPPERG